MEKIENNLDEDANLEGGGVELNEMRLVMGSE